MWLSIVRTHQSVDISWVCERLRDHAVGWWVELVQDRQIILRHSADFQNFIGICSRLAIACVNSKWRQSSMRIDMHLPSLVSSVIHHWPRCQICKWWRRERRKRKKKVVVWEINKVGIVLFPYSALLPFPTLIIDSVFLSLRLKRYYTGLQYKVGPRFGEFCSCCCSPLLPQLACSILPTLDLSLKRSLI